MNAAIKVLRSDTTPTVEKHDIDSMDAASLRVLVQYKIQHMSAPDLRDLIRKAEEELLRKRQDEIALKEKDLEMAALRKGRKEILQNLEDMKREEEEAHIARLLEEERAMREWRVEKTRVERQWAVARRRKEEEDYLDVLNADEKSKQWKVCFGIFLRNAETLGKKIMNQVSMPGGKGTASKMDIPETSPGSGKFIYDDIYFELSTPDSYQNLLKQEEVRKFPVLIQKGNASTTAVGGQRRGEQGSVISVPFVCTLTYQERTIVCKSMTGLTMSNIKEKRHKLATRKPSRLMSMWYDYKRKSNPSDTFANLESKFHNNELCLEAILAECRAADYLSSESKFAELDPELVKTEGTIYHFLASMNFRRIVPIVFEEEAGPSHDSAVRLIWLSLMLGRKGDF